MTGTQSGTLSLTLRDGEALLARDPEPNCEIALTTMDVAFESQDGSQIVSSVTLKGLAWGAPEVQLTVSSSGLNQPVSKTARVKANHRWTLKLNLIESRLPYGTEVSLTMATRGSDQCDATLEASLALGSEASAEEALLPADGCPAGFEPSRNGYVAGHADRFVQSRSYVPLLCSFFGITVADRTQLARLVTRLGVPRTEAFDLVDKYQGELARLGSQIEQRISSVDEADSLQRLARAGGMPEVLATVERAFSEAAERAHSKTSRSKEHLGRPQEGEQEGEHENGERVRDRPAVGGLEYGLELPSEPGAEAFDPTVAFAEFQGATATTEGAQIGIRDGISRYINLGWLGILFYDRLRLRPSGLVAGDQVYSLSLAPGEEVTLTQRSETKRTRSFEEIIDRTTERELEFSSTWSTDFSQADTSTHTTTVGGNLGVNVGVPIEGVQVNVNAGVSTQDSSSISQAVQRARSQEVTTRVTSRAREQHKTTFKVGTEITEELGSKRVLRNANPNRALTLNIYKLYQKYRILLERHNAKLCLSLGLRDPGKDLRRELEDELSKLDPHVPPGACPEVPAGGSRQHDLRIDNLNATDIGGDEFGRALFTTVLPTGTVLSGWDFEITSWTIDLGDGQQRGADPSVFNEFGGNWWFVDSTNMPVIGSSGAQSHQITVLMPEAWGPGWWTVRVNGRFTWHYVPNEAISQEVRACIDAEKKKIRDSFSADRVMQILEEVSASRRELIHKRLFEEVLLPGYFAQGINPPVDVLERVRNFFDWNESVIEYLPWWMTAAGRDNRERLRRRLLGLPGDTRSDLIIDDFLIASTARVYLPVKPGMEAEAVDFLVRVGEYQVPPLDECIGDLVQWREQNTGRIAYPLPTHEQVLGTGPGVGTAAGEPDWSHDWERARKRFLVMDEWSDLLPTDGIHMEPGLSTCGSIDEYRTSALASDLQSAIALRDAEHARAELERGLASRKELDATVVIGDPIIRSSSG